MVSAHSAHAWRSEGMPLANDAQTTQVDHIWTVEEAATEVDTGTMSFADAYSKLWNTDNLRVITAEENRKRGGYKK